MGLFREMADIRAGEEKAQDKPGTFHKPDEGRTQRTLEMSKGNRSLLKGAPIDQCGTI